LDESALRLKLQTAQRLNESLQRYVPLNVERNPQLAFHKSEAMIKVLLAGNGVGKTTVAMMELGAAAMGEKLWWMSKYPPPPLNIWIVQQKLPTNLNNNAVVAKLFRGEKCYNPVTKETEWREPIIPPRMVKSENKTTYTWELTNGSTIQIKSAEQDPIAFASEGIDLVDVDEPIDNQIWTEIKMRTIRRQGSRIMVTMTPTGQATEYVDELMNDPTGYVETFYASTEANPYLSPEQLDYVLKTTPDDLKDVRLHGRPSFLIGQIYGAYDPWTTPFAIPREWTCYAIHDVGFNNPCATAWFAVEPGSEDIYLYQIDYDSRPTASIKPLCDRLLLKSVGTHIHRWYIDPFAARCKAPNMTDPSAEMTIKQMYNRLGIPFELGPTQHDQSGRNNRIEATKLYLGWCHKQKPENTGFPNLHLFDHPDMGALRKEWRLYRWDENRGKSESNAPDTPHKKHDHLMYCLETACALPLKSFQFQSKTGLRPKLSADSLSLARVAKSTMEEHWEQLSRRGRGGRIRAL
jgi:hypothetical protein